MSTGLPAALRDAIARFTEDVAPKDLAARAAALTENYRGGAGSDTGIRDTSDVSAYLTARLPATYAAIAAALDAVKDRAPHFAPARLLDVGSGPGTASWAAAELFPPLQSVTMLDRNPHLLAAARTLAHASPYAALSSAHIITADLASLSPGSLFLPSPLEGRGPTSDSGAVAGPSGAHSAAIAARTWAEGGSASARSDGDRGAALVERYDLVLAAYTFAEIPERLRDAALMRLWNACHGVLLIVEPGTPKGFATILACRTRLLAAGARIVAPCPSAHPCPIVSPDWCHFAERLPRSRAHMHAKGANVPFEDEKFSYVAVARDGIDLRPIEARIVAPPQASKPGTRLRLCTQAGLEERAVFKRDKPAYKAISRKTWGDAL